MSILGMGAGGYNSFTSSAFFFNAYKALSNGPITGGPGPGFASATTSASTCSGPGMPCSVELRDLQATLDNGYWPEDRQYEAWNKFEYVLIDVNGNPVPDTLMTENLMQIAGNVSPSSESSWYTGEQGDFYDTIGFSWRNGPIPDNVVLFNLEAQTFSAYVNGAGWLPVSGPIVQTAFFANGGLVWAYPIP